MKRIFRYGAALALLIGSAKSETAAQPQVDFTQGSQGTFNAEWEGVFGRTYLMQWSSDLTNWSYFPFTEEGEGLKSYGFDSSTDKLFLRLSTQDENPTLAGDPDGEAPLLTISGEWTVSTKERDGDPSGGVELEFHLWPSGTAGPEQAVHSLGSTDGNGSHTFDPAGLSPGDRVEVRMSGYPGQRVYLPWAAGGGSSSGTFASGGNALFLPEILGALGNGVRPNGGGDPPANSPPVFRFEDYFTHGYTEDGYEKTGFPSGFHQVSVETIVEGEIETDEKPSPPDQRYWLSPFFLGTAFKLDDDVTGIPYGAVLSADLEDASLVRVVQRNIFVNVLDGVEDQVPFPNPVYTPVAVSFGDGNEDEIGSEDLPYVAAECPIEEEPFGGSWGALAVSPGIVYQRQLVLGPVPAYVPRSVMGGEPFYYQALDDIRLHSELPLGCKLVSVFSDPVGSGSRSVPAELIWTASVPAGSGVQVRVVDATGSASSPWGVVSVLEDDGA
ncbi:MAG: hypothetical protein KDN05_14250, partial [Verrucomicrobiae bacterium]|nr:hypothetical protein [Verrucomicrobiae bacterium]